MDGVSKVFEYSGNRDGLINLIKGLGAYAWIFDWGMYLFLLAAVGVTVWVFVDSENKHRAEKALAHRIAALIGSFMVLPVFIFKFTGASDASSVLVKLNAANPPAYFDAPIDVNVQWLLAGWGPKVALVSLLGVGVCMLSAIVYSATTSRQRPATEFVNALDSQFNDLRSELQQVRNRPAEPVSPTYSGSSAPSRGVATQIGGSAPSAAATLIERPGDKSFAELRGVSGSHVGQRWELPRRDIKIGRDASNHVALNDGKASREHAKIRFVDGDFTVVDLGSSNGTFVNDQQISGQRLLADGDVLRVGDTAMAFKSVSAL